MMGQCWLQGGKGWERDASQTEGGNSKEKSKDLRWREKRNLQRNEIAKEQGQGRNVLSTVSLIAMRVCVCVCVCMGAQLSVSLFAFGRIYMLPAYSGESL